MYSHESWNSFYGQSFTLLQHMGILVFVYWGSLCLCGRRLHTWFVRSCVQQEGDKKNIFSGVDHAEHADQQESTCPRTFRGGGGLKNMDRVLARPLMLHNSLQVLFSVVWCSALLRLLYQRKEAGIPYVGDVSDEFDIRFAWLMWVYTANNAVKFLDTVFR